MSRKLTPERRRRMYLEAHRDASYTGLSPEHRQAKQQLVSQLEQEHPRIRHEALIAAPRHLDKPLDRSLRAHREHLRQQDRVQQRDIESGQRELDQQRSESEQQSVRARASAKARTAPRAFRESSQLALSWGQFAYKLLGWGIGLSMLYLILNSTQRARKGQSAIEKLASGSTNALKAIADPRVDPLSPQASRQIAQASRRATRQIAPQTTSTGAR